jgi:hypothetical protein
MHKQHGSHSRLPFRRRLIAQESHPICGLESGNDVDVFTSLLDFGRAKARPFFCPAAKLKLGLFFARRVAGGAPTAKRRRLGRFER